jgi:DNA processing protein
MDTFQKLAGDELFHSLPNLREIPHPPTSLYIKGSLPNKDSKVLCVVGSRRHSGYGEETCRKLVRGLQGYNICIVSGLAVGIDGIAHEAALDANLQTIAFPGSGLDEKVLYPARHAYLAEKIVHAGGGLISEFEMGERGAPWTFPQRNRLMAGICDAVLVIEAIQKSGTLITSKLALDYNKTIAAVPGPIHSLLSHGPNNLIRQGAVPITCTDDILEVLGFERSDVETKQKQLPLDLSSDEIKVINLLKIEPLTNEELIQKTKISARKINAIISLLEIRGVICEKNGKFFRA